MAPRWYAFTPSRFSGEGSPTAFCGRGLGYLLEYFFFFLSRSDRAPKGRGQAAISRLFLDNLRRVFQNRRKPA